jgi:hypothetical protein
MENRTLIVSELEIKYNIKISSVESFVRKDPGFDNLLLKLNCKDGVYFYKEIPKHSIEENLNQVYCQLSKVKSKLYMTVLPLISKDGLYCEHISSKPIMIYPFIEHTSFLDSAISIDRLLSCLNELHENIKNLDLASHPFKTYQNWFERGYVQIKKRINEHPLLDLLEKFLINRLMVLDFKVGNIHGDLHPSNIWLNTKNDLYFSDFDNLQKGVYAQDFFDSVEKYFVLDETRAFIADSDFIKIDSFSKKIISNVTKDDLAYLLIRPKLGDLFDPRSNLNEAQIKKRLDQLFLFLKKNAS